MTTAKKPSSIDVYVGARVKMRRVMLGLSQQKLAEPLGLTFQQVQKYEQGKNRMGSSRLQVIAKTLGVTVAWLFEGAPGTDDQQPVSGLPPAVASFLSTSGGVSLATSFQKIKSSKLRWDIINLVATIAGDQEQLREVA